MRRVQYTYVHEWRQDDPCAALKFRSRPPVYVEGHDGFTVAEMVNEILRSKARSFVRTFSSTRVQVDR